MLRVGKQGARGFTLTELIVVLAIGAVLTALALPAVSSLGFNSRNEFKGAAREIYSMLNAARIYATTYNVKCGVVYVLDNYQPLDVNPNNDPGLRSPFIDSITQRNVRCITAAAIMYELPARSASYQGGYAPVPGEEGIFKPILGGMVVPMEITPDYDVVSPENVFYASDLPRADGAANPATLAALGMIQVGAYTQGFGPLADSRANNPTAPPQSDNAIDINVPEDPDNRETFLAHIFASSGDLICDSGKKQRFTFMVTRPPDAEPADRTGEFEDANGDPVQRILTVPIEITKASGRVRIGSRT